MAAEETLIAVAAASFTTGERLTEPIAPMWTSHREASDRRAVTAVEATTAMGTEGNRRLLDGVDVGYYHYYFARLDSWSCSVFTMMFNTIASFIDCQQIGLLAGLGPCWGSGGR